MPRAARVVIPGCPHHITQRGNNRQDVFFVDDDRRVYLDLLRKASERFGLDVIGYCLLTNHLHLVATPKTADSLADALKWTHQLYAQYVNRMHGRTGHLWEGRFYSCPLDENHYWTALIYVDRNPVRAKLVRRAWRWPWSSAAAHCGYAGGAGLLDLAAWEKALPGWDYSTALTRPQDEKTVTRLRLSTSRGRPLGSDSFISKLERTLGRRLRALPRGRPKKHPNANPSSPTK